VLELNCTDEESPLNPLANLKALFSEAEKKAGGVTLRWNPVSYQGVPIL
jgi:hypothetical protein